VSAKAPALPPQRPLRRNDRYGEIRAESQAIFNDKSAHPWPAPQPRSAAPDSGAWQVLHPVTGP